MAIAPPDGFPLAYEVMKGNTSDRSTLRDFLDKIEKTYGKAKRMWVMDRGIPSEETSREMREQPPPRLTAQTRITKSRSRPSGRLGSMW